MRHRWSTLYKPIKEAITALDIAKVDGFNFAMLWPRDSELRKVLKEMTEHGRLNEWLRGAPFPASGACSVLRDMRWRLLGLFCSFFAATKLQLQGRCWHAGFKYMGMTKTPTGFAVSNHFKDLENTTMVASGQQLCRVCAWWLRTARTPALRILAVRTVPCLHASVQGFMRVQRSRSPHVCATK